MNSYLIESPYSLSLENEEKSIIKDEKFEDATISEYDLEETFLENALEDLDTYGFLTNKKVIIIKNIDFIKYDDYKKDFEHLFKYLDNPNVDNLLIIESKKLNNTTKVSKELKKKCKYISVDINSKAFIKNEFKGYDIDQKSINLLDEYCLGDITKIRQECDKLKNYKYDDKNIEIDDIKELVSRKLGDSQDLIFAFSRSLALKDKKDSLIKYRELLSYNIEPLSIIGLLASQFRIIYQVKILEDRNMSDKEIANMLEEKSDYRIKKTRELTKYYSENELLGLMRNLSNIDYEIKTSDVDPNSLIEMFIINI